MTGPRRKRVKPAVGQVVALPLRDGASWGLAHVAVVDGSITIAVYRRRASSPDDLNAALDDALAEPPIATMVVTADEVRDGEWPVIGQRTPDYAPALLDKRGLSHTATVARFLLSAWHGIVAWDGLADPRGYEKLLLPGIQVPPTVRLEKDLAAQPAPPAPPRVPPPTEGPAEVHVAIVYPGDGLPSVDLLRRRQALERRLEADGAGEVTDAGAGEGVMEVFLTTDDVRRALPIVEAALAAAGFADDSLVEVEALDPDDD